MKKKPYIIIVYTVLALLADLFGRVIAERFTLPIWCDSIGTFFIAYVAGPVCGGIVGFTNNIIYGIFVEQQSVYCIVGALIGVITGYYAKKKVFETQFQTMTFGMCLAIFSTSVATIINMVLYDGACGNIWGNQTMLFFLDSGFPKYVSYVLGQFSVEFLDKLLCAEAIFLLIKVVRKVRKRSKAVSLNGGMLLILVLLASLLLNSETVMAEEINVDYDAYLQTTYSRKEGLLSGEANDIEQTKDGKLWIGTYAGLFTYNGSKFRLIDDVPSVKNVNCLYTDEEGRLWVGTNDNGVTVFTNGSVMNVLDEDAGLLANSVKDIICDSQGIYYIGTTDGISLISLSGGVRITKSFEQVKNIRQMSSDNAGNVTVVTEREEIYWLKDGELIPLPLTLPEETAVRTAWFTTDNRLFLGTAGDDILVYNMTSGKPELAHTMTIQGMEGINSFYMREQGDIFICSDTGAAVLYPDFTTQKLTMDDFSSSIENMLVDYQNNLWFSSSRLGLLKLYESPFLELFHKLGMTAVVNTTEIWRGMLYCGTDDGLIVIDETRDRKVDNEISELLKGTRIRCIKADRENNLWIATTGNGIYKIHQDNQGSYEIDNFTEENGMPGMRFRTIYETEDGSILAAGDYGVAKIVEDAVKQVYTLQSGLENEKTLCLLEYEGAYYVGSDGGGITIIRDEKIIDTIRREDGLSSDVILRMVYSPCTGGIFIVTSNGLCYMSQDGEVKILKNFPYSNNYDIICKEDGTCWILCSAGIYIADADDLVADGKLQYPLLNEKNGFSSTITANSWLYRKKDILYLCCDKGVVKINMEQCDLSSKSYRMILDHVVVDGRKYEISRVDEFRLLPDMKVIVFEPEVLNYTINDPYVSYIMEGYETKETACLQSELGKISYTDLPAGTYKFRISVLDGLGGNIVESASYTIVKESEMYQKSWFKLYVMLVSGLVLVWLTWFITRARAQKALLKQEYELEYAKKQIEMGNRTILSIAKTVDAKDPNTSQHSFRVSEYSVAIAKKLNLSEEKCENLRKMALLHDIGKIGIPDAILNKPDRLTDEEYEIMKSHVIQGGEILKDFTMIDNVSVGALYHHEKYDGTGYCKGLKGEEIPLEARIIGIADAFDAMTANRVYRKQLDIEVVIAELKRCSGTQFDPELVEILLSLIENKTIDVEGLYEKSKEE